MTENRDLFWDLLEPEYQAAMMFCRKLAADRDIGDDLYQDALVQAYSRFEDLREPGSFKPWLYRIIVTTFRRTVRRPWWKRRLPMTPAVEDSLAEVSPDDTHAARRWLGRAFRVLTAEEQAMVTLYELEEWSIAELADLHGIKPGTIKVRLHRARKRMRREIERYLKQSGDQTKAVTIEDESCSATKPDAG